MVQMMDDDELFTYAKAGNRRNFKHSLFLCRAMKDGAR